MSRSCAPQTGAVALHAGLHERESPFQFGASGGHAVHAVPFQYGCFPNSVVHSAHTLGLTVYSAHSATHVLVLRSQRFIPVPNTM